MLRKVWDSYSGRVLWGSLALFLLLPALVGVLWKCLGSKFSDGYTLGVYIGTGIAVLWYTVETYYVRRETVRPLIISKIVQFEEAAANRDGLVLRNIGRAPALFVQVKALHFEQKELRVEFDTLDIIEEKQEQEAHSRPYVGDEKFLDTFLPHLDPRYANRTYQVTITYEDVNGNTHKSIMQMGKAGTRLLSHT